MNKIFSFGTILALVTAPAIAEPSHTSNKFPSNGKMLEDYTYTNQATLTNLKVSSGTATTSASYTDCPSAYPNSDDGATSTDQCYTACTVSDFPANSHIASVTGKNYQGANETDTCAIATCDTGYTYNPGGPDLVTIIGNQTNSAVGAITNDGTWSAPPFGSNNTPEKYGISEPNTFGVEYGNNKGIITGQGVCSTQSGTEGETSNNVTAAFGTGYYCWCKIDSYTPVGSTKQTLSAPWVFFKESESSPGNEARECSYNCALGCATIGSNDYPVFRAAMFASVPSGAPSCQANTIAITWADADSADIEANNAGSVTYGGDIRTPRKAVHKAGKVFTGWTFNTPGN